MDTVRVLDKTFYKKISYETIQEEIYKVAQKINEDLRGKEVIFIGILNGSFLFAADLLKHITIDCQITFLKVASYSGTSTTGSVKSLIGINEVLENKVIVILEDIIDTGLTIDTIMKQLKGFEPKEIRIATLLYKPEAFKKNFKIDYVTFEIPNEFVVGYGLDYDGFGRNLKDIYSLVK